ncbi:MAG: putative sugar nucleotidyltransferase and phosphatidyltransferase (bifunctional enzyme) [Nitrospira sp.]|jgi:phosphatidylglycerophosphate synthase|nr:putative sugar nucleotidyltransferase and phosphatidyltransferase (bifunctional enzyme) [Nitrospira sp.]
MSESTLERGAELQGLSTAILVPGTGLFGNRLGRGLTDVGPLTHIGGVSLFQRTVLTLQRAGIRQLIVLAGVDEELLKHTLARGARVTIPVRWMPVREFPLDDPRTWESLATEMRGFCLIAGVQAVFSKALIEHLRQIVRDGEALVVTRNAGPVEPPMGRRNPAVAFEEGRLVSFHNHTEYKDHQVAADLVVLPASILNPPDGIALPEMAGANEAPGAIPVRRWLERAAAEGRVRVVAAASNAGHWYRDVWDQPSAGVAERTLLRSLKGDCEGFVDRYFNRLFSPLLTRAFLWMTCSPNVITMIATAVGLLSAVTFGFGTYQAGIIAALLFQLAAIIDCCDGEVARLTFTESPFGAWLDIAMDNLVHIAIFAGIACGLYLRQDGQAQAWVPLALGGAAIFGNAMSFWLVTKAQKIGATCGWNTPKQATWSDFILKNVASRDFSVVVFLFALLDKLDWFLWMAAAGSTVFWLLMLWVLRPSAQARA